MMNRLFRCCFIIAVAAGVAAVVPAAAAGQDARADSLARQIGVLERRVADLERRIRELETIIAREPSEARPTAITGDPRDRQNWRQLRNGMTMDQVRALLGEPERVDNFVVVTVWRWTSMRGGNVSFDRTGKVEGWSEPPW
jgi:hypothetical protein